MRHVRELYDDGSYYRWCYGVWSAHSEGVMKLIFGLYLLGENQCREHLMREREAELSPSLEQSCCMKTSEL